MLLLIIHWIACFWFFVVIGKKNWFPPKDLDFRETNLWNGDMLNSYILLFYYATLSLVGNELLPTD